MKRKSLSISRSLVANTAPISHYLKTLDTTGIPIMVLTPSTMAPLTTAVPNFELPDTEGNLISPERYRGKPLLIAFISNHCPFVVHLKDALRPWYIHSGLHSLRVVAMAFASQGATFARGAAASLTQADTHGPEEHRPKKPREGLAPDQLP